MDLYIFFAFSRFQKKIVFATANICQGVISLRAHSLSIVMDQNDGILVSFGEITGLVFLKAK